MSKLFFSALGGGRRKTRQRDIDTHWQGERAYWSECLADWYQRKYSLTLDPIQNDPTQVPPLKLVTRIQKTEKAQPDAFLATGQRTVLSYLQELDDFGYDPRRFERILDFGVGLGRLLRHYYPLSAELYGCDVVTEVIEFSRQCLGQRVMLAQNDFSPPLPYADAFFDYVYANSVFTHIQTDTLSQWIAELARITRPGGCVIISVYSPNRYLGHIAERDFDRMLKNQGYLEWGSADVRQNCLYATPAKLREWWSGQFEVLALREHFKDQDHLVLKRL